MDALDLTCMDAESLKKLYHNHLVILHEKLLAGADWKETSDLRNVVTELEIQLDKKVRYTDSVYNPDYQAQTTPKSL